MRLKIALLIIGLAAGLVCGYVTPRARPIASPVQSVLPGSMVATMSPLHTQSSTQIPTQPPPIAVSVRRVPSSMPTNRPVLTATHVLTAMAGTTLTIAPATPTITATVVAPVAPASPTLTLTPAIPTHGIAVGTTMSRSAATLTPSWPPTATAIASATQTAAATATASATQTATATATASATQTATATATASATPQLEQVTITEVMTPTHGGPGTVVHAALALVSEGATITMLTYSLPAGMRLLRTMPLAEIEPSAKVIRWHWPNGTPLLPGESIRMEIVMEVLPEAVPGVYRGQIVVQGSFPPQQVRGARFTVPEVPAATATQTAIIATTPTITPTIPVTPTVTVTPIVTPTVTATPPVTPTVTATPPVTPTVTATSVLRTRPANVLVAVSTSFASSAAQALAPLRLCPNEVTAWGSAIRPRSLLLLSWLF